MRIRELLMGSAVFKINRMLEWQPLTVTGLFVLSGNGFVPAVLYFVPDRVAFEITGGLTSVDVICAHGTMLHFGFDCGLGFEDLPAQMSTRYMP